MAEITISIRADEDDLREFAGGDWIGYRCKPIAAAIAAAMPRIQVRPGMVLRRNDGVRYLAAEGNHGESGE